MEPKNDPLRLLHVRHVHHAGFIEAMTPWGLRGSFEHQALMRVRGASCWALHRSRDPVGVKVEDGDLVVFLTETRNAQLTDALQSRPEEPYQKETAYEAWPIVSPQRFGGRGPLTRLCGASFELDDIPQSLKSQIRPMLVIASSEIDQQPMLAHLLDAFEAEVSARRAAQPLVVARLLESVLVMALRCQGRQGSAEHSPVVPIYTDRYIGKAFRVLDETRLSDWKVSKLASRVGLSRRSFARRFAHELGEAPQEHLARRRMDLAKHLLQTTDLDVGEVATWVGYESVAAFCRAFKRREGVSPNQFRKSSREASPPPSTFMP